ncbi:S1 family peptidase [Micromonospora sp. NBC_01796]|uniref:S1 family peptidase n=1 Tax=Micromonospora sp. NBC_01796 TaxID=2975987 RepID=UPI002DDC2A69|nr:S1 family peptidase [Micromonospora sp. NBC_01796]WSA83662.1 S1 family peptidase [Micromonospora sp. NBC_01796]
MRRSPFLVLLAVVLLLAAPTAAQARPAAPEAVDPARAAAILADVRTAGTVWGLDPATGRMTLTVDDTVGAERVAALRATADRAGAVVRHEPGRLTTLIAGGQGIQVNSAGRCSLGANVRSGSTHFFITAGHCTILGGTWYAQGNQAPVLGTRVGTSFPGNDYGLVRYTNGAIPHPSAVYTYPGLLPSNGIANAYVGQRVCRSGSTTGVRCGTVVALNQTVNYSQGSVHGLIRTNICAEPGDSGGPLYDPANGNVLGILSGGSGNCTSGGTTYYQPIAEILAAYGVTLP